MLNRKILDWKKKKKKHMQKYAEENDKTDFESDMSTKKGCLIKKCSLSTSETFTVSSHVPNSKS